MKTFNKINLVIMIFTLSLTSCGSDDVTKFGSNEPDFEFPANALLITKALDIGNSGNGSDIRVDFNALPLAILNQAEEVRFIVSKTLLTEDQAKALTVGKFESVGLTEEQKNLKLSSAIKDSDGGAIANDVAYKVYFLLKAKELDEWFLSDPKDLVLKNRPVLAGNYIGIWNDALFDNFRVTMMLNDDYTGVIFYSNNFTTCCPVGGASDATVEFVVNGSTITSFEANQFLGSYRGGNCPATYTATGTVTDEITLSLTDLSGTDCDGNHAPGQIVFTRQ